MKWISLLNPPGLTSSTRTCKIKVMEAMKYSHQVHLTKVLVGKRSKEHALEHRGGDGQDQLVRGHNRAVSKAEPEHLLTDDT